MWIFVAFLVVIAIGLVLGILDLILDLIGLLFVAGAVWRGWQVWQAVHRHGISLPKSVTSIPWELIGVVAARVAVGGGILLLGAVIAVSIRGKRRLPHELHRRAEWAAEVRTTPTVLELGRGATLAAGPAPASPSATT